MAVNRRLYSLLLYFLLPLGFLRLLLRALRAPAYARRWSERLGYLEQAPAPGAIWIHAVSVGETIAAAPLVKALRLRYPDLPICVTTTTPTGSERVRALFGDSVSHSYVPYDLPGAVRRFLDRLQPCLLVVMETELWPNLVHQCHQRGVPVIIANARLSQQSQQGYARFPRLIGPLLQEVSLVVAQARPDGERFLVLGLAEHRLRISGSIKFDLEVPDIVKVEGARLRAAWGITRPVLIAASTHDGEDQLLLDTLRRLREPYPDLLLLLVPRHPERFEAVASLCKQQGFSLVRRSSGALPAPTTQILLGDTMGELMRLYAAADLAFVGGSLVPTGGHNFLEPAALGLPIVAGPHQFNFAEIGAKLSTAGALITVTDTEMLAEKVADLIAQPELRKTMGAAGMLVVRENRGALNRLLGYIEQSVTPRPS